MAERTIRTKMVMVNEEEYISAVKRIASALREASEAKREFDALFPKAPSSTDG